MTGDAMARGEEIVGAIGAIGTGEQTAGAKISIFSHDVGDAGDAVGGFSPIREAGDVVMAAALFWDDSKRKAIQVRHFGEFEMNLRWIDAGRDAAFESDMFGENGVGPDIAPVGKFGAHHRDFWSSGIGGIVKNELNRRWNLQIFKMEPEAKRS